MSDGYSAVSAVLNIAGAVTGNYWFNVAAYAVSPYASETADPRKAPSIQGWEPAELGSEGVS